MRYRHHEGFSLVELVLVTVIIGIVGAIAIPRLSSAGENARDGSLVADVQRIQKTIDVYVAEHAGLGPAHFPTGAVDTRGNMFKSRLIGATDADGTANAAGIYGPYLRYVPANPNTGLGTVRIDGAAAGAGTHGWHFHTPTSTFSPDDAAGKAVIVKFRGADAVDLEADID